MQTLKYQFEPIPFDIPLPCVPDAAVDSKGRIFAMTDGAERIAVFDQTGKKLYGWGEGVIKGCHGLYIDPEDNVFVVDSGDHTVKKFGAGESHPLLMTLGTPGVPSDTGAVRGNFKTIKRGAGPFYSPSKVTVSPKGEIFVCDGYGNSRVHRFSSDGELLASWGEPGGQPGEFRIVHGVGVDEDDRIYVADRENNRVQIFDVNGKVLDIWENIMRPDGLCVANGMAYVAELGHIFYVDNVMYEPYENMPWSQVRVFDLNGKELCRFGGSDPTTPGNMWAAHSINVDGEGSIYIGEAGWPSNEQPLPDNLHPALQKFKKV
ncbi:MAG: peptidyl-alpha-hydroxyglycine alpha-amidating lyase family protein [Oscillospiraceae bacterium]|jgi:sugar lactone lactonase YvrE|nr:peptidyl-alpha-hydroxyglycine alpha-amidating lyase family protein [Oscillospiraceae bacterium]